MYTLEFFDFRSTVQLHHELTDDIITALANQLDDDKLWVLIHFCMPPNYDDFSLEENLNYSRRVMTKLAKNLGLTFTEQEMTIYTTLLISHSGIAERERLLELYNQAAVMEIDETNDTLWYARETIRYYLMKECHTVSHPDFQTISHMVQLVKPNRLRFEELTNYFNRKISTAISEMSNKEDA